MDQVAFQESIETKKPVSRRIYDAFSNGWDEVQRYAHEAISYSRAAKALGFSALALVAGNASTANAKPEKAVSASTPSVLLQNEAVDYPQGIHILDIEPSD